MQPQEEIRTFLDGLSPEAQAALPYVFDFWALPHQRITEGDWKTWVIMGGRGAGKTRAGSEWVRAQVEGAHPRDRGRARRVALVGETYDQAIAVMVKGESGILACSPPDRRPKFVAGERKLIWSNGATPAEGFANAAGKLALFTNGGWEFITPATGWQACLIPTGARLVFDGTNWRAAPASTRAFGGGVDVHSVTLDITLTVGNTVTTEALFPERSIGLGVTGRVTSAITGSLTSWAIGAPDDPQRFGTGLSLIENSWLNGPQNPFVYWSATPLALTAEGGVFSGGSLRLVAHFIALSLPDPV